MKKRIEQYPDLPIRYQRKGKSKWFEDTISGKLIPESEIHCYTASFKANKEQEIINKRWDLKRD